MVVFAIFGGRKPTGDVNIEEVLSGISVRDGKVIERDDVTYVKSMNLDNQGDISSTLKELNKGNIVILNVTAVSHNKLLLRGVVSELRNACMGFNGDLARLSEEKIIVLPNGMKISHAEGG